MNIDLLEILECNVLDSIAADLMCAECDDYIRDEYNRLMPDQRDYIRRFMMIRPALAAWGLVW